MDFKIDKKIPLPAPRNSRTVYPLDAMEVGHSFQIPAEKVQNLREAIARRHRRTDATARFTVRKTEDGYRCWRLE